MKTLISVLLTLIMISGMLAGCSIFCKHEWTEATCYIPKTCAKCGETEGEPNAHFWQEATCSTPKTCAKCGETEGEPNAHFWQEATCETAKMCTICKVTEGSPLMHNWTVGTCTIPVVCTRCDQTKEPAPGHKWTENSTDHYKKCDVCHNEVEFFYSLKDGELLVWTEYEIIDNNPANPISYDAKSDEKIEWLTDGNLRHWRDRLHDVYMFYVDGKIYYQVYGYCDMNSSIARKLAMTAGRYLKVRAWIWGSGLDVTISNDSETPFFGLCGEAHAAFDASGKQYVIILDEDVLPNKAYAVKAKWK